MKTENHDIHQLTPQELNLHLQVFSTFIQMMRMQMMMHMI
jgi:hypothetical protein